MALTDSQIASLLFKASQGKSSTNTTRQFFEEPYNGRPIVVPEQVWNQAGDIPDTAPGGSDQETTGVVQRWIALVLTAVPGTTNSFYSANLVDCIPFNFGDGTSYNYTVVSNTDAAIPFGQGDWLVDPNTGTLTFYGTVPSNMPPKISFYKYVGTKGVGGGDTDILELTVQGSIPATPDAGKKAIYAFNDGKLYSIDDSGVVEEVGSGAGTGKKNYIKDSTFETATADWFTYDDASAYVDGTGGSASITADRTTSSPLAGAASLLISKSAVDSVNEGVSVASETIDIEDRGAPLFIQMSYDFSSANYVSGDMQIKAYDVTNSAILNVFPIANLDGSNGLLKGAAKALAVCYPPSTCTQVRVSLHMETDSATASAWTGKIDSVLLGPDSATPTNVATDWTSYSPIFQNLGTVVPTFVMWRREGPNIRIMGRFAIGTPTTGAATMSFPSGVVAGVAEESWLGDWRQSGNSTDSFCSGVMQIAASGTVMSFSDDFTTAASSGSPGSAPNASVIFRSSSVVFVDVSFPVLGWTTGNLMSSFEASLSAIKVMGAGNAGDSITALTTNIPFIEVSDNFGAWNGTTFTAPKDMDVLVQGCIASTAAVTTRVLAYVNAVQTKTLGVDTSSTEHPFSGVVSLTKGQSLTLRTAAMTLVNSTVDHWISITEWVPPLSVLGAYNDGSNVDAQLVLDTGNGHGSTNTAIRRFTNAQKNTLGAYATYADSGTAGMSVTINIPGTYSISYTDHGVGSAQTFGVSKNSAALTTSIVTLTYAQGKMAEASAPADGSSQIGITERFLVGDVIRAHTNTAINGAGVRTIFRLTRIGS